MKLWSNIFGTGHPIQGPSAFQMDEIGGNDQWDINLIIISFSVWFIWNEEQIEGK